MNNVTLIVTVDRMLTATQMLVEAQQMDGLARSNKIKHTIGKLERIIASFDRD